MAGVELALFRENRTETDPAAVDNPLLQNTFITMGYTGTPTVINAPPAVVTGLMLVLQSVS